jgi:hypothetical protein
MLSASRGVSPCWKIVSIVGSNQRWTSIDPFVEDVPHSTNSCVIHFTRKRYEKTETAHPRGSTGTEFGYPFNLKKHVCKKEENQRS